MRISVIIPTYNRAPLVVRAVRSALTEAGPGDEVLVVDDGSTDDTRGVLGQFAGRVRMIEAGHAGAGAARNRGIAEARNPLAAFLDSDDEWLPGHLALHRGVLNARPDVAFSFANFAVCDAAGQRYARYLKRWHLDARPWSEILGPGVRFSELAPLPAGWQDFDVFVGDLQLAEMQSDFVPTFTMVARRDCLPDANWFADDVPVFEDWQCFGRLAGAGLAAHLDCETAVQHGHRLGRLTDVEELKKLTTRILLMQRVWGADVRFMARNSDAYGAKLLEHRLARARCLLGLGQMREARAEMRLVQSPPLSYRLLSLFPGPLAAGVVGLRRRIRGLAQREGAVVES